VATLREDDAMKTNDLISLLANHPVTPDRGVLQLKFVGAIVLSVIASVITLLIGIGINPDIAQDTVIPMFWVKLLVMLAAAALVGAAIRRAISPGKQLGAWPWIALSLFVLLWCVGLENFFSLPASERTETVMNESWNSCLLSIPLLALPIFVALILGIRQFAPTQLTLSGALAGLSSGAAGAAVYALHCNIYDPSYVAMWYSAGIAIPTIIGAILGRMVLRW
jgi:hypothetical protein